MTEQTDVRICHCSETAFAVVDGLRIVIVDRDDAWLLQKWKWNIWARYFNGAHYAHSETYRSETGQSAYLHRAILPGHARLDHISGNGLDCRKQNLRGATHAENNRNKRKQTHRNGKPCVSVYKGVSARPKGNWQARIKIDQQEIHLGVFDTEIEAAQAYDRAAVVAFGEFARLNFPRPAWSTPSLTEIPYTSELKALYQKQFGIRRI
jgi:hypothetical protein